MDKLRELSTKIVTIATVFLTMLLIGVVTATGGFLIIDLFLWSIKTFCGLWGAV